MKDKKLIIYVAIYVLFIALYMKFSLDLIDWIIPYSWAVVVVWLFMFIVVLTYSAMILFNIVKKRQEENESKKNTHES